ncbi:MAG: SLC13 family permease [Planctomycetota bacterium]
MNPFLIVLIGTVAVVGCILALRLHAFLALLVGALLVASLTSTLQLEAFATTKKMPVAEFVKTSVGERVTTEFGSACGKLGVLIALASIVGKCMMDSGAADRVVRSITRVLGEARAPLAFLLSGFVLSIPVFFDTVFLLMVPLCKAMWMRTRKNYVLYFLAVIATGSMNHSLFPLTPGPLFLAQTLKIDMGLMMVMGCVVGLASASAGMIYAVWIDRKLQLPVRESLQCPLSELEAISNLDERSLPPLWLSLLPVLLPVLLIGGNTLIKLSWDAKQIMAFSMVARNAIATVKWFGDPNIALMLSAGIAIVTLATVKREKKPVLNDTIRSALADGGQILMIIAAGAAFGGALQQTGIGTAIQEAIKDHVQYVLPIAFLVTVFVRGAQGSATVAMITAAGIFAGMATKEQLGFHPVYLALVIGCGSKPLSWMNDSGFWVIGKMSGLTESETLKTFSAQISIEGTVGMLVVMGLSRVMPMV